MEFGKRRRVFDKFFFLVHSNHIWVKGSSERMQFAACMEEFNYCLIIDWKIRGRECSKFEGRR